MRIRIYYEDTDCGGILYHTNYIKYCERARSELFFSRGLLPSQASAGFVVSAMEVKFLGFARLGDMLEVRSKLTKLGKVQIVLLQDIYKLSHLSVLDSSANILESAQKSTQKKQLDNSSEEKIFSAQVRLGYVDVVSQKPVAIPKHLEQVFLELGNDIH